MERSISLSQFAQRQDVLTPTQIEFSPTPSDGGPYGKYLTQQRPKSLTPYGPSGDDDFTIDLTGLKEPSISIEPEGDYVDGGNGYVKNVPRRNHLTTVCVKHTLVSEKKNTQKHTLKNVANFRNFTHIRKRTHYEKTHTDKHGITKAGSTTAFGESPFKFIFARA